MITTDRLLLRPHTLDDLDAHLDMSSEPEVYRFLAGRPATREECWDRLLRYAGHWSTFGYGLFAAVERETGRFIGDVGLARFCRGLGPDFDGRAEAGWVFRSDAHGRGFAQEAAEAAHAWFQEKTGEHESVCIIRQENTASVRLAEKLGYRLFGTASFRDNTVAMFRRRGPECA
jgi:RimJ/RimL family protein N-acetyltransferase